MKCIKTCISLILVCLLMAAAMPTVSAASTTVTVATVTARPGDTVTVPISVTEISGLKAIEIHLQYDTDKLEYVSGAIHGFVESMNMASANKAVSTTNEVWLTAVAWEATGGSGDIFSITFKVKENAPEGLAAVSFTNYDNKLLAGSTSADLIPFEAIDGGVMVSNAADTQPPATTTTGAMVPVTDETSVWVDENGAPVTRADGETVTLPPAGTAVDINGAVVTDASGNAVAVPYTALMVGQAMANPGEEVTVPVSMSAVANMTVAAISIRFDTNALTFVGGSGEGFLKEDIRISCDTAGVISISATGAGGFSGSGTIAKLTFRVNNTAKKGDYRLALSPEPQLLSGQTQLPLQLFAGEIVVESDGEQATGSFWWVLAAAIVVAVGIVAIVLIVVLRRRQKPIKAAAEPKKPSISDISGDDL